MTTASHHLTVGGEPFCRYLGTQAGLNLEARAGRRLSCNHPNANRATLAARELRQYFRRGAVRVVCGECPDAA